MDFIKSFIDKNKNIIKDYKTKMNNLNEDIYIIHNNTIDDIDDIDDDEREYLINLGYV